LSNQGIDPCMHVAWSKKKAAPAVRPLAGMRFRKVAWLFSGIQATIYQYLDFNTLIFQTVFLGIVTCYWLAGTHCGRINDVLQRDSLLMQEINDVLCALLAQLLVPIGVAAGAREALHINQVAFHSLCFFR